MPTPPEAAGLVKRVAARAAPAFDPTSSRHDKAVGVATIVGSVAVGGGVVAGAAEAVTQVALHNPHIVGSAADYLGSGGLVTGGISVFLVGSTSIAIAIDNDPQTKRGFALGLRRTKIGSFIIAGGLATLGVAAAAAGALDVPGMATAAHAAIETAAAVAAVGVVTGPAGRLFRGPKPPITAPRRQLTE